jgi:predicted GIY-YIG superfamily endonuclease
MPFVYILKCADGSYYTGSTINLERRLAEHTTGFLKGYTESRRPVKLVWSAELPTEHDAFLRERQIKGWSRAKKEALIRGDWEALHRVVRAERQKHETKKRAFTN